MSKQNGQRGLMRLFYVGRMDANLGVCGFLGGRDSRKREET